jgi:hypothetical protein
VATPEQFAANMRKHGKNVEKNAQAIVRKCALAVDASVVISTPVDKGRARANWQVSLGSPAGGTIDAFDLSGKATIAEGANVISSHTKGEIYITNNLPYIGRLNDGWSAQAPAGFVTRAVLVGIAAIKGVKGIVTGSFSNG